MIETENRFLYSTVMSTLHSSSLLTAKRKVKMEVHLSCELWKICTFLKKVPKTKEKGKSTLHSLEHLKKQFKKGFYYPKPLSKKFQNLVLDELFTPEENIAGPLYSLAHSGNCDYTYDDKENRFNSTKNADNLYKWFMQKSKIYHKELQRIKPSNHLECRDLLILTKAYRVRKNLCLLAYQIQKNRDKTHNKT